MSSSIRLDEKTTINKVCGWTLLVRLDTIATQSPGGIAFGEQKITLDTLGQTRATVLDIAEDAWSDEKRPRCAVGDHILFRQYAGEMLDVEGPEKYRIINDKDVYALLDPLK